MQYGTCCTPCLTLAVHPLFTARGKKASSCDCEHGLQQLTQVLSCLLPTATPRKAGSVIYIRLTAVLPPSPPLPYHYSRNRGHCSPLEAAAVAATRPLRRDPPLSHARCRASLCTPPRLLHAEESARATDRNLRAPLLSRSSRLRIGDFRRGGGDSSAGR
jgi:hypothetical protein